MPVHYASQPMFQIQRCVLGPPLMSSDTIYLRSLYCDLGRNKWYWYVHADISAVQLKMATN